MIKINNNTVRHWTVILSFILGWVITFCGFFAPPQGEVDSSVLVIFGQAMTYCAVGVGLKDYVDIRTTK